MQIKKGSVIEIKLPFYSLRLRARGKMKRLYSV